MGVEEDWTQLAIDMMHYQQGLYLLMIDCEPRRVTIWREIRTEIGIKIAKVLEVFLKRGPVTEVLIDSSTTFHSAALKEMLEK